MSFVSRELIASSLLLPGALFFTANWTFRSERNNYSLRRRELAMNADMTHNVTLPVRGGSSASAWGLSNSQSFSHNGGHLSIEFVDDLQNDKLESSCQQDIFFLQEGRVAEMKAAEAMEYGRDKGPRDEVKGRFCIATVKSHSKLTSGTSDPDTCIASEIGAPPCLSTVGGRAGRELQSQAHTGAQHSTPPLPYRSFPTV